MRRKAPWSTWIGELLKLFNGEKFLTELTVAVFPTEFPELQENEEVTGLFPIAKAILNREVGIKPEFHLGMPVEIGLSRPSAPKKPMDVDKVKEAFAKMRIHLDEEELKE